ncbi:nucleolar protein 12 [Alosa pseudoharengus]|uniref:nucleolar protein 12 n=1 Tax=Alosa pseudoharengus TaxID=34774 RepID=UPI003F88E539
MGKNGKFSKGSKHKPGSKKRENKCIVMFDEKNRQDFLTGFHKRKIERRKAAVEEIKQKLKEEQKRVREDRHKEYLKMLQERKEALDDADELEDAITGTTESVQYDHPNHTVTVTTISDLDLTKSYLLGMDAHQDEDGSDAEEQTEEKDAVKSLPKKAGKPLLSKKIKSLSASLNMLTKQPQKHKRKGKQEDKGQGRVNLTGSNNKRRLTKTTKTQRRRRTGKRGQDRE